MITFGNSVQEFYLRTIRKNYQDRKKRLASFKTKEDVLNYVAEIREKIKKIFQFPAENVRLICKSLGNWISPAVT